MDGDHDRRPATRRCDEVGAVDDAGRRQPPVERRAVGAPPHPEGSASREWEPAGSRRYVVAREFRPPAEDVGEHLGCVGVGADRGQELGDELPDAGPGADERRDVDGDGEASGGLHRRPSLWLLLPVSTGSNSHNDGEEGPWRSGWWPESPRRDGFGDVGEGLKRFVH